SLSAPARRRTVRAHADRHAHRRGASRRRPPRPRRRRDGIPHEAVFAGSSAHARRHAVRGSGAMATPLETNCSDDLTAAYRRLNAAYQQALRYAEDVRALYQQLQRGIYQSLLGLANALEAKDVYTRGHSERVGATSRRLAGALGLPPTDVEIVGRAGLLHDIGKIGIPEGVLRKPGAPSAAEWPPTPA